MQDKPKLAIVAGIPEPPRLLELFRPLQEDFNICVFVLERPGLLERHGAGVKLKVFPALEDMPGYMRGLEQELAGFDGIIGVEDSTLATFQAARAAAKFKKPFGVVVHETRPYVYENHANIRAVQFDVRQKADVFWASSAMSYDRLVVEGVEEHKIERIVPLYDAGRFSRDQGLREKFRRHLKLKEAERLLLVHEPLEPWARPEVVLQAFGIASRRLVSSGIRPRLLFAGDGTLTHDLKYKAYDAGLGDSVMFLHQNPEPFLVDLYCASDVMVRAPESKTDRKEVFPHHVIEAMACGLPVLVGRGTVEHEVAATANLPAVDESAEGIAAGMMKVLTDPAPFSSRSARVAEACHKHFNGSETKDEWTARIARFAKPTGAGSARTFVEGLADEIKSGRERDALAKIEEAFASEKHVGERALLWCLKGDAYLSLNELDAAREAYGQCVKLDDNMSRCYRGLGYMCWYEHSNEEALKYFRKALALQEDDPEAMVGVGLVYRRLGLTEEAVFWLEKAVTFPECPSTGVMALSQACLEGSVTASAIESLERVIDSIGENRTLLMTLGQLYMTEGHVERGHEMIQMAMDS